MSVKISTTSFYVFMKELDSPAEGCGLCEQGRGDTFWPTHDSRWAHGKCVQKILPATQRLSFKIESPDAVAARKRVIEMVKKQCEPMTIIEYLEINGVEKVSELFNKQAKL